MLELEQQARTTGEDRSAVTLTMLGPFSLRVNGRPIRQWKAGRARALLQYLLVHHDEPVDRGRVMNDLWPVGKSPETSLKVATHALRTILDSVATWSPPSETPLALVTEDNSCELRTGDARIDWVEFRKAAAAAAARHRAGRFEDALTEHARAAELAGPDLLEGESDMWLLPHREHTRDQALNSLLCLMRNDTAHGEQELALDRGHQILKIDRCHEPTYQSIIRCHGRLCQPGRARHWFDLCQRLLSCELGVSVHEDTRRALREAHG